LISNFLEEIEFLEKLVLSTEVPEGIKYAILFALAEKIGALVIANSNERKLRRSLCRLKSSTRINRALAILRREGVLTEDEYRGLRGCLRAVRCHRNLFLHPVCAEKCPNIAVAKAMDCVKEFLSSALRFIEKKSLSCR